MTEQEKVIEALQKEIDEATYPVRPRKFMFPLELAEQILALLEAPEPRLMTIDELFSINNTDSVVFVERRTKTYYNEMAFVNVEKVYKECVLFHGQKSIFSHDRKYYGKEWRCWTSRPSDEQRRNTPWT